MKSVGNADSDTVQLIEKLIQLSRERKNQSIPVAKRQKLQQQKIKKIDIEKDGSRVCCCTKTAEVDLGDYVH